MEARDKQNFIERWEDYVNEFDRLGYSTDSVETWEEIKRLREDMKKLIHKIAEETYD
jgi:hypothetical protein